MPLVIRPARADELQPAEELVARSINDLTVRHGFGAIASVRPAEFQHYCLQDDPDGVWVAEDGGEIAGFALSWVCGGLWFLAELFVAPQHQGRGIGNELFARTWQQAAKSRASHAALITFTFNVVSQGLYVRQGLLPRVPLYMCSVPANAVAPRAQGERLQTVPIEPTREQLGRLAQLDLAIVGIAREKHHRHLLADARLQGVFLHDAGECVGYAYVSEAGHIGPLAVAAPGRVAAAFRTALALAAASEAARVSAFIPGASDALSVALEHGMRIALPMVLLSSREFGDWTRYLPRNPGFM